MGAGLVVLLVNSIAKREEIKKEWVYRDTIARKSKGQIPLEFKEELLNF